jgi:hypothetical protein
MAEKASFKAVESPREFVVKQAVKVEDWADCHAINKVRRTDTGSLRRSFVIRRSRL